MATQAKVTLYTRVGCHLCEEAKRVLDRARRRVPFALDLIDIDHDEKLRELYDEEVPVIAINGRKSFKCHVTEDEFLKRLAART